MDAQWEQPSPTSPSCCRTPPTSPSFCRTPPASPLCVATPSPPPPPDRKVQRVSYMVKLIFHSLEELSENFVEENRKRQRSEEALEAQRQRKVRILMSLR